MDASYRIMAIHGWYRQTVEGQLSMTDKSVRILAKGRWSWCLIYLLGIPWAHAVADDAPAKTSSRKPVVLTDDARRIHAAALVADGHNDFPWEMRDNAKYS